MRAFGDFFPVRRVLRAEEFETDTSIGKQNLSKDKWVRRRGFTVRLAEFAKSEMGTMTPLHLASCE